jgi:hypothetical protein
MENHAVYFKQYVDHEDIADNALAFDVSFLDLQFIGKDVEVEMQKLLSRLKEPTRYEVRNGFRQNKNGEKVQAYTNRTIDLSKELYAVAIHTYDISGELTMPHFHFLLNPKARLGKDYSLLKEHIKEIAKEFKLMPHFSVRLKGEKKLGKAVKRFTWNITQKTDKSFVKLIHNSGIDHGLEILLEYVSKTDNLSYYVKSLDRIQTKLKRVKKDYFWRGFNLRYLYPIPLSSRDKEVIQLIKKTPSKKEMEKYFDNPIMRDYVRYSAKTTRAYIIESMMKHTTALIHLRRSQKIVEMYNHIQNALWDQDIFEKEKFYEHVMRAAAISKDEKEFKAHLQKSGYKGLGFLKSKGYKIGFFYYINREKRYIYFKDLGMSWSKITTILMANAKEKETIVHLHKSYQHKIVFDYYQQHIRHDFRGYYIQKKDKSIELENQKKGIKIVDKGHVISSKRTTFNNEEKVALMLKIAMAKGWKIENIFVSGSKVFVQEFKKQKEEILKKSIHKITYINIEEFVKKRAKNEKQIREIRKKITSAENEYQARREYNMRLSERVRDARGKLENRRGKSRGVESEVRQRSDTNSQFEKALQDSRREADRLKEEIARRKEYNQRVRMEIDTAQQEVEDIEQRLKEEKRAIEKTLQSKFRMSP